LFHIIENKRPHPNPPSGGGKENIYESVILDFRSSEERVRERLSEMLLTDEEDTPY
jgi:hypothetical protein